MGYEPDHVWTEEERRDFSAGYLYFQEVFYKLGGKSLPITVADALLVWLKVYSFETLLDATTADRLKKLEALWPDVKGLSLPDPIAVSVETQEQSREDTEPGFWGKLMQAMQPSRLRVAFFHKYLPSESGWIRDHDLGREYLEAVMGDQVEVEVFSGIRSDQEAVERMEAAAEIGRAHV